jgi:transcriptional regulator with XRE-family HTH domain
MTHSPYISKVLFGRQLQQFRMRANSMSAAEAARRMGMSVSKYRKLEAGTNDALRLPDAYAAAYIFGLSTAESQHLVALVEAADKHGWYHDYDVSPEFAHFIEQEGAASTLNIYEQSFVTGLFQTEDYLEALKGNTPGTKGGPDSGLREQRREAVLGRSDPPEIVYLTDEAALRRQVGGRGVMREQIRHLLELDERDNITIYVVPFEIGVHPGMAGSFWIMYFADRVFPTTVYLESLHGSHYEDAEKIVRHYQGVFGQMRQAPLAAPIKEFIDESNLLA